MTTLMEIIVDTRHNLAGVISPSTPTRPIRRNGTARSQRALGGRIEKALGTATTGVQITIDTLRVTLETAARDAPAESLGTALASNGAGDAVSRIPHGHLTNGGLAVARTIIDRSGISINGGGADAVALRRTAAAEQR